VISRSPWFSPPSWGTSFSRMLFTPMTLTQFAAPPHEHQPLLLQEAAGLRLGLSITQPLKPAFRVGLK
jgi:hypothetical protein